MKNVATGTLEQYFTYYLINATYENVDGKHKLPGIVVYYTKQVGKHCKKSKVFYNVDKIEIDVDFDTIEITLDEILS